MKRTLSSFVSVLCLLAFFVSSAACFAVAPPQQKMDHASHSMSAPAHACCPSHAPDLQISNQCCVVHHQPASAASTTESQLVQFAALPFVAIPVPSLDIATSYQFALPRPTPLQTPPLIALRI
ncbi:hypothetical protein [Edaphobacter albus]|uniref:hypothetical protein n=1 Tax=Edaphobacter sp. 4G125 TaxID=2763071 RepID=UPI0016493511|nr:hypothetical protein [Edaphobacter sp. 4G125]QNI38276.1 hypothetical protein H7846_08580 [Edaphobacter sp. 4G125]